jgi:glyoxylase-like metal-dependent hydrolase (beta-lactamase superfamily II)
MKVYYYYSAKGLCNCYMLGDGHDALIIDPGCVDEALIDFIEKNKYALKGILITHNHANHINGLRSLKRIYRDAAIYSANGLVMDYKTNVVRDGDIIDIGSLRVNVISVPGHSIDSVVYLVEHLLFTGDVLSAGLIGRTDSSYGAMRQIAIIQNKLFTLPGNYIVLPGHGPPTTLNVERGNNIGIGLFDENRNKTRRTSLSLELLDYGSV